MTINFYRNIMYKIRPVLKVCPTKNPPSKQNKDLVVKDFESLFKKELKNVHRKSDV